jgi:hypothetical protein
LIVAASSAVSVRSVRNVGKGYFLRETPSFSRFAGWVTWVSTLTANANRNGWTVGRHWVAENRIHIRHVAENFSVLGEERSLKGGIQAKCLLYGWDTPPSSTACYAEMRLPGSHLAWLIRETRHGRMSVNIDSSASNGSKTHGAPPRCGVDRGLDCRVCCFPERRRGSGYLR